MKKIYLTILISILILPFSVTAEDSITKISNIQIKTTAQSATISWRNPNDPSFSQIKILRSTFPIADYHTYKAISGLCDEVYRGTEEIFTDTNLVENLPYYYILYSQNKTDEYSKAVILEKKLGTNNTDNNEKSSTQSSTNTLAGANAQVVNEISLHEAGLVYSFNKAIKPEPGSNSARLSLFIIVKSPHDLTTKDKNAISYFIASGTPTTILLGTGERAGVLNSYLSVFNKLPTDTLEWQDVIKISNGRWPNEKNLESEKKASDTFFTTIYKRSPDMGNPNDNAAVTVIAYGLRPAERNMESEKNAINIYRSIFKKVPIEASDWDLVRAIAYSGASR